MKLKHKGKICFRDKQNPQHLLNDLRKKSYRHASIYDIVAALGVLTSKGSLLRLIRTAG
jgi:hypothetical protein